MIQPQQQRAASHETWAGRQVLHEGTLWDQPQSSGVAAEQREAHDEPEPLVESEPRLQPEERSSEPAVDRVQMGPSEPGEDEWHERALRLQADMENYRKRQQRLYQERVEADRQRMLRAFLDVVDDLERALDAPDSLGEGLREGVGLTHRSAMQFLKREGVEQIRAENQPFDPNWHEAVATVDHNSNGQMPNTNIHVTAPGYRLGEQLLRPAKVIVAV